MILVGIALAVGGVYLVTLEGSAFYLFSGLALIVTGGLLFRRRALARRIYGAFMLLTLLWALWESGLDLWALLPRVAMFAVIGAGLLLPLGGREPRDERAPRRQLKGLATLLASAAVASAAGLALHHVSGNRPVDPVFDRGIARAGPARVYPASAAADDWREYGNDLGGSRFSALSQINASNVRDLKVAWQYRVGPGVDGQVGNIQATPLKVGNSLYVCTAYNDVIALDSETGKERWRFRSGANREGLPYSNCRGVSYFETLKAGGECPTRIITTAMDGRLLALDASTGRLCTTFGNKGVVSLLEGMGKVQSQYYFVSSAPTIVRGKVIVGGLVADGQYWGEPSGVIRAFDATTGSFAWAFDVGRPDRQTQPPPGETYTRSTPNSWGPMSADAELGLVFAPTGNATPDYYGAQRRPFDDQYASSVVAIDVETGRPRWSFQTVHHDLWDYDVSSQPTLINLADGNGGTRRLLLQPSKTGQLFLLDRVTGRPVADVIEKPVPQAGAAPGERLSPTQPFSVGMPSLAGPNLTERMMWGVTPLDQLWCRIKFRSARYEGPFTPPGLTHSIDYPGFFGGSEWGGASVDLDRRLIIANTSRLAGIYKLIPRAEADRRGLRPMGEPNGGSLGSPLVQKGTPFAAEFGVFMSPLGNPCQQPPFGIISAIDLDTRKVVWSKPLGTTRGSGPVSMALGLSLPMGVPNIGGSVATRGGLTFIGASTDGYLRAFDTATGKLVWKSLLPAGGQATPMTYRSAASGRQFVAISASGHYALGNKLGDYIVAYALPH